MDLPIATNSVYQPPEHQKKIANYLGREDCERFLFLLTENYTYATTNSTDFVNAPSNYEEISALEVKAYKYMKLHKISLLNTYFSWDNSDRARRALLQSRLKDDPEYIDSRMASDFSIRWLLHLTEDEKNKLLAISTGDFDNEINLSE